MTQLQVTGVPSAARTGAWRRLLAVTLVFAIYLALWVSYAANGLVDFGRYVQAPPGAAVTEAGVTYRLISLQRSSVLADQDGGDEPKAAAPNAVWVVGQLEVTRHPEATEKYCSVTLLGPQRREWATASIYSGRTNETDCSAEDLRTDVPTKLEVIFEVPARFADQVFGIVVYDQDSSGISQVIRPG